MGDWEGWDGPSRLELERQHAASPGAARITDERIRQVWGEGWTPQHDDTHTDGSLVAAAMCYATEGGSDRPPVNWPWESSWWKQHVDPVRNLVIAGALIAAEIDRLQRAALADERKTQ